MKELTKKESQCFFIPFRKINQQYDTHHLDRTTNDMKAPQEREREWRATARKTKVNNDERGRREINIDNIS